MIDYYKDEVLLNKPFTRDLPLLPCPFCGGKVYKFIEDMFDEESNAHALAWINCDKCGIILQDPNSPFSHNLESLWNSRPIDEDKYILRKTYYADLSELNHAIHDLQHELDLCEHVAKTMTQLHNEKCKEIDRLNGLINAR